MMEAASSEHVRVVAGCEARLSVYGRESAAEDSDQDQVVGTQSPRGFAPARSHVPSAN
jgi:hypothetical protein